MFFFLLSVSEFCLYHDAKMSPTISWQCLGTNLGLVADKGKFCH